MNSPARMPKATSPPKDGALGSCDRTVTNRIGMQIKPNPASTQAQRGINRNSSANRVCFSLFTCMISPYLSLGGTVAATQICAVRQKQHSRRDCGRDPEHHKAYLPNRVRHLVPSSQPLEAPPDERRGECGRKCYQRTRQCDQDKPLASLPEFASTCPHSHL